jgi:hypothetical protein
MKITRIDLEGSSQVVANLNKEVLAIRNRSRAGMAQALLTIKRETLPLTPVLTGNLRRSMRSRVFGGENSWTIWGAVWFEAAYALWVHERKLKPWGITIKASSRSSDRWGTSASGRTRQLGRLPGEHGHRPPTQWKFLEEAIKRQATTVLQIIRDYAGVK